MSRRRPASGLRAARAGVATGYCAAPALAALVTGHPLVLGALLASVLLAAAAAGAARPVCRALAWAAPFALLLVLINALVTREGLTVVFRAGELPPFGAIDVTLEAIVQGGVLALRALVVIGAFALLSAAVDPDELLRALRRRSVRSALTAAVATRMVPVLARDARRLHDAQRCRPGPPVPRLAIVRAVSAGALERALDVAATLEVRGYGTARRPPRLGRPWSRHDLAFAAAGGGALALAAAGALAGWAPWTAYPALEAGAARPALALAGALAALLLAPLLERRGVAA